MQLTLVLLACLPAAQKPLPAAKTGAAEMHVLPARLTAVTAISSLRISIPTDLRTAEARRATWLTIKASRWSELRGPISCAVRLSGCTCHLSTAEAGRAALLIIKWNCWQGAGVPCCPG